MPDPASLSRLTADLYRLTGLRLAGDADEPPEETAKKLQAVLDAFREKNSRREFFRKLLLGQIGENLGSEAARLHLPMDAKWAVFVVETEEPAGGPATDILRQMFAVGGSDSAVLFDAHRIALVRQMKGREKRQDYEDLSHTVVDMLNTEGMLRARVGFTPKPVSLRDIQGAFRESVTALEIGRLFYSHEKVMGSDRLGLGRLLYDIPEATCRRFLDEVAAGQKPHEVDPETQAAVEAFFENNLNISETARQLFVHRNTLVYRLEKLRQATGLDVRVFEDAITYRVASLLAARLTDQEEE